MNSAKEVCDELPRLSSHFKGRLGASNDILVNALIILVAQYGGMFTEYGLVSAEA